jgi:hypothetical protein
MEEHSVYVCFEDGSEIFWDKENSTIQALDLARELEIELKAVLYIKNIVVNFIEEMKELLYAINADEELIKSIIRDGHQQALNEINFEPGRKLLLESKPVLREKIFEKTQDYVI